ncbi:MAG: hypothetical protein BIFFINMI_02849 [Phycisphaerae bacterium]|nr:hypothetical protein [Phycisphaerae bacterium]
MTESVTAAPVAARLPDALLPPIVTGVGRLLDLCGPDGALGCDSERDYIAWWDLLALALAYTRPLPDSPYQGDPRVRGLIERTGRAIVEHFYDSDATNRRGGWYDGNRVHEWLIEHWLAAWMLLRDAGHDDLAAPWTEALADSASDFARYCRLGRPLRRLSSPNLKISTNHFAYFVVNLIRLGQVFDRPEHVALGMECARRIVANQHPDGYWPETHGPTTSYNHITTAAVGLFHQYTGEPEFLEALRRAINFHQRWSYPSGACIETIDQRVRYRAEPSIFSLFALSRAPAGRGLAEAIAAAALPALAREYRPGQLGRLVTDYLYYQPGPVQQPLCRADAAQWRLTDLPAGAARRGGWTVVLSGIPSRSRPHRYTLDRQNLLSVWHDGAGLVLGGGGDRDRPTAATFHGRIGRDPHALIDARTADDACLPVASVARINDRGGSLELDYWGYDATLSAEIVDATACRVWAEAATLPVNDPVTFNPNVLLDAGQPLTTGAGLRINLTENLPLELNGKQIGGWIGQGRWRIELPADASLRYPVVPYAPSPGQVTGGVAVVSIPVTNRRAELTVRMRRQS